MVIMLHGAVELLICQYMLTNLYVHNIFFPLSARLIFPFSFKICLAIDLLLWQCFQARFGAEAEIPPPHIPSKLCKCKHRTAAELHLYSWSHTPLDDSYLQRADLNSSHGEKPSPDQILHFWAGQTQLATTVVSSWRVICIKDTSKLISGLNN